MKKLRDIAPRLAKAHAERLEELRLEAEERRVKDAKTAHEATLRLRADWLVAHRELQVIRALHTGSRRYMKHRQRKLAEAQQKRKRLG
jgi:hypothetical protein